ncbi:MAG: cytidylate kinase family protein [Deltaproteobacteria bacterium]|nr:cytidylate kinase family protein [Deltaproteobacteria bacterium]
MSSIIIASDSPETGRRIADETAKFLGYTYMDPEDVLSAVATKRNLDKDKLKKVLDTLPSSFGRTSRVWRQWLAFIQEATLGRLMEDQMVCHGLAAHLYVMGVSHILKVRIITSEMERLQILASQRDISADKAKKIMKRMEKQRHQWCLQAFQMDETDPSRYDLVISLNQITAKEAVKTIAGVIKYKKFKPMTYSIKCLEDLELESRVRASIIKDHPEASVTARDKTITVKVKTLKRERKKKTAAIKELVGGIDGVDYVEVHFINDIVRQAAESFR